MKRRKFLILTIGSAGLVAVKNIPSASENTYEPSVTCLSSMPPRLANQGWGPLLFDKNSQGGPLKIRNRVFAHGVSTHASSDLVYLVAGRYSRFRSWVGVDAESPDSKEATARFLVYADGSRLLDSGVMNRDSSAQPVDVDVTGVNILRLVVTHSGTYARNVDWAEAELIGDPDPSTIHPPVYRRPAQSIRSGDLTLSAKGGSLEGLALPNGSQVKLIGYFGMGAFAQIGRKTSVRQLANITAIPRGFAWEWKCSSQSHRPWTAPVDTVFRWPNPSHARVWLPCGHGSTWQDPLLTQAFEDRTYDYGAFFNRENGLSLPMATVIDEEIGIGLSFIQSPRDVILDLQISTTKSGEIRFSRAFHRFGGKPSNLELHMDLVIHEPDVRAALNAIVERYPEYFDPPNQFAHQVGGGGAYSGWEGTLDVQKLSAMGFSMNWKASLDFPYMGMFLPPVNKDEKWNRFAGGGEGDFGPQDEGRYGQTSIRQMSGYSTDMRAKGFHVLNYLNVTEFGAHITYPTPAKEEDDPNLWKTPNDCLHGKLESAVLKMPNLDVGTRRDYGLRRSGVSRFSSRSSQAACSGTARFIGNLH